MLPELSGTADLDTCKLAPAFRLCHKRPGSKMAVLSFQTERYRTQLVSSSTFTRRKLTQI